MADKTPARPDKKAEAEKAPEPKKKLPLMKMLILAGVLLAQTAAAYFIQKTLFFPSPTTEEVIQVEAAGHEGVAEEGGHGKAEEGAAGNVALLDEIIVNPAGTGGRRFLSTIVGLTLKDAKAAEEITTKMPIVRDAAISVLASKSLDQLASLSYRDTLRQELQVVLNEVLDKDPVDKVVFSTYVLQ